jgi:3D (Asp-Asp-Asp) domain-containing protein
MPRVTILIIFAAAFIYILNAPVYGKVLGVSSSNSEKDSLQTRPQIVTTTAFDQKNDVVVETIPFETQYKKDSDMEYGLEKTLQEGVNGKRTLTYLVTFWKDEEIDRQLTKTEVVDPVEEIIGKGSKIIWRTLSGTEYGRLKYWYKVRVWATKYDANCIGCTGRTYSGTQVVKGVCATDPKVITLGTNFYVPGYGMCRAEDIGGAIKGNKIDLGYVDASEGAWRTGYVDIYHLTSAPE